MSIKDLRKNQPYRFVPVVFDEEHPAQTHPAGFHDGSQTDRCSGQVCCTLTTRTPTLVGHFQYPATEALGMSEVDQTQWIEKPKGKGKAQKLERVPTIHLDESFWGKLAPTNRLEKEKCKVIVEPLFHDPSGSAPEETPVLIPGTSIKGMLRQMIGAMTHAPMERVADNEQELKGPTQGHTFSLRPQLGVHAHGRSTLDFYMVTATASAEKDNPLPILWTGKIPSGQSPLPDEIEPDVVNNFVRTNATAYAEENPHDRDIDPGPNEGVEIWVEYDSEQNRIVSFGRIKNYRWASADSTQRIRETSADMRSPSAGCLRPETHPPEDEKVSDGSGRLTGARLLFGYVDGGGQEDEGGTLDLGIGDGKEHARLAGRIAINHAVEQSAGDDLDSRFVRRREGTRTLQHFNLQLGILSSPKPQAFWCYVAPGTEESTGLINSWGDLPGIDAPNAPLAGRKFYLRWQPGEASIQTDDSETCQGTQNQIARFVSRAGRTFRFTLRFRDLSCAEMGLLLLALDPLRFRSAARVMIPDECQTLWHSVGHGRPLGMGAVTMDIDRLEILDTNTLTMNKKGAAWMTQTVEAGAESLCHPPSLQRLWSIMQPLPEPPNLETYYGNPKQHTEAKNRYLENRRR